MVMNNVYDNKDDNITIQLREVSDDDIDNRNDDDDTTNDKDEDNDKDGDK